MFINSIYIKNQKTQTNQKKKTKKNNNFQTSLENIVFFGFFVFFGLFGFFCLFGFFGFLFFNISGVYKHSRFEFTAFV